MSEEKPLRDLMEQEKNILKSYIEELKNNNWK